MVSTFFTKMGSIHYPPPPLRKGFTPILCKDQRPSIEVTLSFASSVGFVVNLLGYTNPTRKRGTNQPDR
jgi:hypothetical protein